MMKKIKNFLTNKNTSLIFVRSYSFSFLFAIYHAYRRFLKEESGCGIYKNVLVYKDKNNLYEFFVKFENFTPCLVEKINSRNDAKILHDNVSKYYEEIKEFESDKRLSGEKVFYLTSRILAFEALTFIIPYIARSLKIPLKDKLLVKKCEKARIKTEKLFAPKGEIDTRLKRLNYLPRYLKNYNSQVREFILFDDKIIADKKIINEFKKIKKEYFEKSEAKEIKGFSAYKGKVKGRAKIILSSKEFSKMQKGDIIVAHGTTPDYMPIIKICSAIVSDEGGFLCHAAIVSRELKIPCIMGTKIATKVLKDGDLVEVDANKGAVKILKRAK